MAFEYKITVKAWMRKKSSPDFTFMEQFNNDVPMPLMVMYTGGKVDETARMVRLSLHGDLKQRITDICMCCGREISNPISRYFGMGPKCGEHNYVNPFDTEEELINAVGLYREKLLNTTWLGWIPLSAIVSINDVTDPVEIRNIIDNMPWEIIESELPTATETETTEVAETKPVETSKFIISARIDTPVRCTDDYSVFLSFRYDRQVVDMVKALPTRFWNPDDKEWEIPYNSFKNLQDSLADYEFDIKGEDKLPTPVDIDYNFQFKTVPMEHQSEGVHYGLNHSRWLLGDDQGLGKTKQIIDLAMIRKKTFGFAHCLIVCGVNGLKWNWIEEIQKHSDESGWILGQLNRKKSGRVYIGSNADKIADLDRLLNGDDNYPYFLITNIESLRNTEITEKLKELCDKKIIQMVAVDEIHRCKNLNTQQGAGMMQLQPYYRIGMTGTPLMNSPLDLYAIFKWLGYQPYAFGQFKYHFCNVDEWGNVIGYKNIDQLRGQLDSIMLRRTKAEVLDLPSKIYQNEYVDLTDEQKKLYNQVITNAVRDTETPANDCILATLLRLRQISGGIGPYSSIKKNPKLDRLEQLVEEAVYSGTKVIVYSNWIEGIKPAIERLAKYNPVVITGETKDNERQEIVNRFQNDDSVKVIFGTVGALGTGLTLTAATEVVFLDEPWTNATKEQACDRAHRIGTTSAVTIHTIISHGTYDENVHDIVLGKRDLTETIVEKKDLLKLKIA